MEKTNTSDRLKQIMREKNLRQVDIIEKSKPYQKAFNIKLGKSALSQYISGKSVPDQHKVFLLSKTLEVSEPWLMGFDVPRNPENNSKKSLSKADNIVRPSFKNIPVIGSIACGEPITAQENVEEYLPTIEQGLPSGDLFYLKATGDSMSPIISDGARVLCRAQSDVENGEIAAVLVNGDTEATLKRVRKTDFYIMLEAINDEYDPYIITASNPARIVGKAVQVVNDL